MERQTRREHITLLTQASSGRATFQNLFGFGGFSALKVLQISEIDGFDALNVQTDPILTPKIDSKVTPDPILVSLLGSLWGGTLESRLGHFTSFCVSL